MIRHLFYNRAHALTKPNLTLPNLTYPNLNKKLEVLLEIPEFQVKLNVSVILDCKVCTVRLFYKILFTNPVVQTPGWIGSEF